MLAFRQRPLTWLFFVALACLNVVALAGNFESNWYSDLIVAQVFVAAGWLALGRAQRLARAGALVAVLLASVLPDYFWDPPSSNVWRYMLGSLIVLAAATTASCWGWMFAARAISRRRASLAEACRFSVAEILGSMIVVAVGSIFARQAVFSHLGQPDAYWVHLVVASSVAALLMTVFLYPTPLGDWGGAAVAMIAIAAAAVYFSRLAPLSDFQSLLRAYAVVAVWVVVQRLDARPASGQAIAAPAEPALRVFDPASDDERRLG